MTSKANMIENTVCSVMDVILLHGLTKKITLYNQYNCCTHHMSLGTLPKVRPVFSLKQTELCVTETECSV
jgi:hypothetical protein